jgi:adenosylhomocysteine nucleosidase
VILVTFAVPFESAAFRKRAVAREVRIVHTGVGTNAARDALARALSESRPELVISSGFAGALVPGFQIGEIVMNREGDGGRLARFATAPDVLATTAQKRDFHTRTGAEIVDMETDAIGEVCDGAGLPWTVLRAVSDCAEDDLALPPDLLEALAAAPVLAAHRLVWMLLLEKQTRRNFRRFLRDCRAAQLALADALESTIRGTRDK